MKSIDIKQISMHKRIYQIIKKNTNYLKGLQIKDTDSFDYGAIYDPVLKEVIGDNYATEEYALAASYLSNFNFEKSIELAMDFHTRTTDGYPYGKHSEHTQHRRLGFIETYRKLGQKNKKFKQCLKKWKINKSNPNCNWLAMNALLDVLIYKTTENPVFLLHSWLELYRTLKFQLNDGFFSDSFDSKTWSVISPYYCPIAYHAYTSALLHRYWKLTGNKTAKKAFLKGADIILWLTPKNGNFSFRGRSGGHIFTYGIGYYLMEATVKETKNPSYKAAAKAILNRLENLQDEKGRFPIVANQDAYDNKHPTQEPYAYHSVYNAHCTAWLARSLDVIDESIEAGKLPLGIKEFLNAGLIAVRKEKYTCIVSNGRGGNNDSALSIVMLDVNGSLCSLMHANRDEKNFLSAGHVVRLLKKDEIIDTTVGAIGDLKLSGNTIIGKLETKNFVLKRKYFFEEELINIQDNISSKLNDCVLEVQFTPYKDSKIEVFSSSNNWILGDEKVFSQYGSAKKLTISVKIKQDETEISYGIKVK